MNKLKLCVLLLALVLISACTQKVEFIVHNLTGETIEKINIGGEELSLVSGAKISREWNLKNYLIYAPQKDINFVLYPQQFIFSNQKKYSLSGGATKYYSIVHNAGVLQINNQQNINLTGICYRAANKAWSPNLLAGVIANHETSEWNIVPSTWDIRISLEDGGIISYENIKIDVGKISPINVINNERN